MPEAKTLEEELRALGLTEADGGVLLLTPMALIAWADGDADMEELQAIAERHCPLDGHCANGAYPLTENGRRFLNNRLLYQPPGAALRDHLIALLARLLEEAPETAADRARGRILAMCREAAEASGGLLGIFGKICDEERAAMRSLFLRLRLHRVPVAAETLEALDIQPPGA